MGFPMTYRRVIDRSHLPEPSILADDIRRLAEDSVTLERARIRAAVLGLHSWGSIHTCWDDHEGPDGTHLDGSPCNDYEREAVDRKEVLAAIDGEGE